MTSSTDAQILATLAAIHDELANVSLSLAQLEQRMQALETFVSEAKAAVAEMPPLPFFPRFKFSRNGKQEQVLDARGT